MSKTSLDKRIANVLVKNAVNDGFRVSVNEAGETIINPSRSISVITEAMFRNDTDTLALNVEERHVGIITLIYGKGSGPGVIAGHTNAPHINRLVEHTLKELEPSSTPNLRKRDKRSFGDPNQRRWISGEIRPGIDLLDLTQTFALISSRQL